MSADPFQPLLVLDKLEIGPVLLECRRLTAPYRISRGCSEDTFNLVYSYEEDVFDPGNPSSRNLASVMAAQVALNYGLFCRELVFHGDFDEFDRLFVEEMADNTAREIFVNKILKPTGFLYGEAARMEAIKAERYLRSRLTFTGPALPPPSLSGLPTTVAGDRVDRQSHAVLSSGGKDSLLSFGLLNELGCPVHPIFINESGRHWYTALNAYRHLRQTQGRTARVWTNCDRLFNWMLRRLPFVRNDYARVRSDEYPIRLWTVAVFLFGALPLLRKRGIGRLIVGDEYDTTRIRSFQGIPHYDGLYDQSILFDRALSGYFRKKGWNIRQFSMLRCLTEILIEKVLVERYPRLQEHQVSCHAAHIGGGRVYPCGRCEKCRRIVSILLAIGADPKSCGYTDEQIGPCLEGFTRKGIHHESEDMEALWSLLENRGILPPRPNRARGEAGDEAGEAILKVRIDPERSPAEEIPADLRRSLLEIFLNHSMGAVRLEGDRWEDLDLNRGFGIPAARQL